MGTTLHVSLVIFGAALPDVFKISVWQHNSCSRPNLRREPAWTVTSQSKDVDFRMDVHAESARYMFTRTDGRFFFEKWLAAAFQWLGWARRGLLSPVWLGALFFLPSLPLAEAVRNSYVECSELGSHTNCGLHTADVAAQLRWMYVGVSAAVYKGMFYKERTIFLYHVAADILRKPHVSGCLGKVSSHSW